MANVQKQFEIFHDRIRDVDDSTKREKREMLIEELSEKLTSDRPSFSHFNQGSYAMHTRVAPLEGDDDIDVGLVFTDTKEYIGDSVTLKKDIRDAISRSNRDVRIRRPCVTVQYFNDGEPNYHVDLAVYAKREDNAHLDLAVGREHSPNEERIWDEQDPKDVINQILEAQPKDSSARPQFRRCIRDIKRWRDNRYGNKTSPPSIALTSAARHHFQPSIDYIDDAPDDLAAILDWVQTLLGQFAENQGENGMVHRIQIELVAFPYTDLMVSMTDAQQEDFYQKLIQLRDALDSARTDDDLHSACKMLQKQFGDDFPVPEKSETAKTTGPAVISTGSSA